MSHNCWPVLLKIRQGVDAPVVLTVWRDNLGGIVLGVDEGDGAKVVLVPLSGGEVADLTAALNGVTL